MDFKIRNVTNSGLNGVFDLFKDLIRKFDTMILNFDKMFIRFE